MPALRAGSNVPSVVLLADDSVDVQEMYALALSSEGFRIIGASNGLVAIERAAELRPDVVVTDLRLGGLDGFEVCSRLKADPRTADIPVIALTGLTHADLGDRADRVGFDSVLIKPCLPADLAIEIRRVLALSRPTSSSAARDSFHADRRPVRRGRGRSGKPPRK